jgi:hypothetical protein
LGVVYFLFAVPAPALAALVLAEVLRLQSLHKLFWRPPHWQ